MPPKNSEITVCIITKNERSNITKCLTSFDSITNNFIIADTGSTDDTKQLAISLGAQVHDFQWISDFSAARNFVLSKVQTPWTIMLDADQYIDPDSAETFKSDFQNNQESIDLFYLSTEFCDQKYPLARAWRTSLNLRYKYPVHEYLDFDSNQIKSFNSSATIHHAQKSDFSESRKKYIEIMKKYIKENGPDNHIFYYLVSDSLYLNNQQEVLEWGQKYLKNDPPLNERTKKILLNCAKVLVNNNQFDQAKQLLDGAKQIQLGSNLNSEISNLEKLCSS